MTPLEGRPGTYALILLATSSRKIEVGRIGTLNIEPGYYVYVGSALGPGGVRARISRHARKAKTFRWHIDYLRATAQLIEVWCTYHVGRRECQWSQAVADIPWSTIPLAGFGSSDCQCVSHLHQFAAKRSIRAIRSRLKSQLPDVHQIVSANSLTGSGRGRE
jgi:Uri superfamily endonuclease